MQSLGVSPKLSSTNTGKQNNNGSNKENNTNKGIIAEAGDEDETIPLVSPPNNSSANKGHGGGTSTGHSGSFGSIWGDELDETEKILMESTDMDELRVAIAEELSKKTVDIQIGENAFSSFVAFYPLTDLSFQLGTEIIAESLEKIKNESTLLPYFFFKYLNHDTARITDKLAEKRVKAMTKYAQIQQEELKKLLEEMTETGKELITEGLKKNGRIDRSSITQSTLNKAKQLLKKIYEADKEAEKNNNLVINALDQPKKHANLLLEGMKIGTVVFTPSVLKTMNKSALETQKKRRENIMGFCVNTQELEGLIDAKEVIRKYPLGELPKVKNHQELIEKIKKAHKLEKQAREKLLKKGRKNPSVQEIIVEAVRIAKKENIPLELVSYIENIDTEKYLEAVKKKVRLEKADVKYGGLVSITPRKATCKDGQTLIGIYHSHPAEQYTIPSNADYIASTDYNAYNLSCVGSSDTVRCYVSLLPANNPLNINQAYQKRDGKKPDTFYSVGIDIIKHLEQPEHEHLPVSPEETLLCETVVTKNTKNIRTPSVTTHVKCVKQPVKNDKNSDKDKNKQENNKEVNSLKIVNTSYMTTYESIARYAGGFPSNIVLSEHLKPERTTTKYLLFNRKQRQKANEIFKAMYEKGETINGLEVFTDLLKQYPLSTPSILRDYYVAKLRKKDSNKNTSLAKILEEEISKAYLSLIGENIGDKTKTLTQNEKKHPEEEKILKEATEKLRNEIMQAIHGEPPKEKTLEKTLNKEQEKTSTKERKKPVKTEPTPTKEEKPSSEKQEKTKQEQEKPVRRSRKRRPRRKGKTSLETMTLESPLNFKVDIADYFSYVSLLVNTAKKQTLKHLKEVNALREIPRTKKEIENTSLYTLLELAEDSYVIEKALENDEEALEEKVIDVLKAIPPSISSISRITQDIILTAHGQKQLKEISEEDPFFKDKTEKIKKALEKKDYTNALIEINAYLEQAVEQANVFTDIEIDTDPEKIEKKAVKAIEEIKQYCENNNKKTGNTDPACILFTELARMLPNKEEPKKILYTERLARLDNTFKNKTSKTYRMAKKYGMDTVLKALADSEEKPAKMKKKTYEQIVMENKEADVIAYHVEKIRFEEPAECFVMEDRFSNTSKIACVPQAKQKLELPIVITPFIQVKEIK